MIYHTLIGEQPLPNGGVLFSHSLGMDGAQLSFLDMRIPFELYVLQTSKYGTAP